MTKLFAYCETENGETWANAWKEGAGSRHEMFEKIGVKCRTLRDPNNHNSSGVLFDIPDMAEFDRFMETEELKQAMVEDGLKVETLRLLTEFKP